MRLAEVALAYARAGQWSWGGVNLLGPPHSLPSPRVVKCSPQDHFCAVYSQEKEKSPAVLHV